MELINLNQFEYSPLNLPTNEKHLNLAQSQSALLPQMPPHQLATFAVRATQYKYLVAVQLNSENYHGMYLEIIGFISLSEKNNRIIIRPYDTDDNSVFVVRPRDLRHIRRYQK